VNIWKRAFAALPKWRWTKNPTDVVGDEGAGHLSLARESLRDLINDTRLPAGVRESLSHDYEAVQAMLDKIDNGHLHLSVFGRVSTGKSSLLNALIGEEKFSVSPVHGETKYSSIEAWNELRVGGVFLIDTPGLDEAGGEDRESLAKEVAGRSDLVIFVIDSDITDTELDALKAAISQGRPILLALNKSDLYTAGERDALLQSVRNKTEGIIDTEHVIAVAAQPRPQIVIEIDDDGNEQETRRNRDPDIAELRLLLWEILEAEGKTLAALNASLFASDLSDQVGQRILAARRELGEKLVRTYCVAKGIGVAFNPVPVSDLFSAAFIDVGMVVLLSKVYDLPLNQKEAGSIVKVIMAESAALMGTVWALHFVSSALKVGTIGLSTILTAGAQGSIAYYSTYLVGEAAAKYLAEGKSWGEGGPKLVVKQILDSLDRDTVLRDAKREIQARLGLS
jgi:small GTP-binding protein